MAGEMMDWLESPTIFIAAILALPVLWFAKRSLADEDDRVGVLGVWLVMAIIVLYLLWYGGGVGSCEVYGYGFTLPMTDWARKGEELSSATAGDYVPHKGLK